MFNRRCCGNIVGSGRGGIMVNNCYCGNMFGSGCGGKWLTNAVVETLLAVLWWEIG